MSDDLSLHGIYQEASDYRIHVGLRSGYLYTFRTKGALTAIKQMKKDGSFELVSVGQEGVKGVTAKGVLIPCHLLSIQPTEIPTYLSPNENIKHIEHAPLKMKGLLAVRLAREMLHQGLVYFPPIKWVTREATVDEQHKGIDFFAGVRPTKIEVKFDWHAGPKELGGSGNLFIQVEERNPRGII